jgi:hypothetical protein
MTLPPPKIPTNAQRALELMALGLPGADISYRGRQLNFRFDITPGTFGRTYRCLLKAMPDGRSPDLFVLEPNLSVLAGGKKLPHIYPHSGKGTELCLWLPGSGDWTPQMQFGETYIPWTAEWLYYFEVWLATGEWEGGGAHPDMIPKRWSAERRSSSPEAMPYEHSQT